MEREREGEGEGLMEGERGGGRRGGGASVCVCVSRDVCVCLCVWQLQESRGVFARFSQDLLDTQEIFWALSNVGFDPYSQVGTVCARARMRECRSSFVFYSSNCKSGYIGAHV